VFCLFYNWPLTLRRRMRKRSRIRGQMNPRYWHIVLCVIAGLGILGVADLVYLKNLGALPSLKEIWPLAGLVPLLGGALVTLGAGGAPLSRRLIGAVVCGSVIGGLYTVLSTVIGYSETVEISKIAAACLWRVFIFAIFSSFGAILTELNLPEPTVR
jgi:hypothetical protein